MNPSLKFAFDEIFKRLDAIDARMERSFSRICGAPEQHRATAGPRVGIHELRPAAQSEAVVEADNWGGLFEPDPAPEERLHEPVITDSTSPSFVKKREAATVVPDNWEGLFEQPSPIFGDRDLNLSVVQIYAEKALPSTSTEGLQAVVVHPIADQQLAEHPHITKLVHEYPGLLAASAEQERHVAVVCTGGLGSCSHIDAGVNLASCGSPLCPGTAGKSGLRRVNISSKVITTAQLVDSALFVVDTAKGARIQLHAALRRESIERVRPSHAPTSHRRGRGLRRRGRPPRLLVRGRRRWLRERARLPQLGAVRHHVRAPRQRRGCASGTLHDAARRPPHLRRPRRVPPWPPRLRRLRCVPLRPPWLRPSLPALSCSGATWPRHPLPPAAGPPFAFDSASQLQLRTLDVRSWNDGIPVSLCRLMDHQNHQGSDELPTSDVVISGTICVRNNLLLAASEELADLVTKEHFAKGLAFPSFTDIRAITRATKVYEFVLASLLPRSDDFIKYAENCMYTPTKCSMQVCNSISSSSLMHTLPVAPAGTSSTPIVALSHMPAQTGGMESVSASMPMNITISSSAYSVDVLSSSAFEKLVVQKVCEGLLAQNMVHLSFFGDSIQFRPLPWPLQSRQDVLVTVTVDAEICTIHLKERESILKQVENIPGEMDLTVHSWATSQTLGYISLAGQSSFEWKPPWQRPVLVEFTDDSLDDVVDDENHEHAPEDIVTEGSAMLHAAAPSALPKDSAGFLLMVLVTSQRTLKLGKASNVKLGKASDVLHCQEDAILQLSVDKTMDADGCTWPVEHVRVVVIAMAVYASSPKISVAA